MRITEELRITPGGMHAWYMTSAGFAIRKPLGDHVGKWIGSPGIVEWLFGRTNRYESIGFWSGLVAWIKSWFN